MNSWKNLGYDSYNEYLGSQHWLDIRKKMIEKLGEECEVKGCKEKKGLQIHHLHYQTIGTESFRDLVMLCPKHHKEAEKTKNESLKNTIKRYVEWGE